VACALAAVRRGWQVPMGFCNMARWKRLTGEAGGSQVAEFAVVLPIVVMLLFGILWFARAFNIYSTITYAAREGANAAVVGNAPTCATCGTPPTPPQAAAAAVARVQEVLQASHIDPGQIQTYIPSPAPTGGACGTMTTTTVSGVKVYSNARLNAATSDPPSCGVIVSFQYPFTFSNMPFASINKQTVYLKADAQMQGEY
jgi:TadE-like protein